MEIETSKLKSLFFSGIGGSGMSALAQLLAGQGRTISGSDRKHDRGENPSLFEKLAGQGIDLFPQDGSGVKPGLNAVIVSTAVESDTPDYRRAEELGLPVIGRPALLAGLVNRQRGFCIAGTSGKSTVTALSAYVMEQAGLEPNFLGGAAVANWSAGPTTGNALSGASDIYIVEACESDGSISGYRPAVGAILNIERDHQELEIL
ncbi:MAG TPA: Mur ligase domain-containing protein, partial [Candidatus Glassbacteria bacterium]|nr:Mur ligase domain-containing protein [Candidatus Glassbacteria bacterium]